MKQILSKLLLVVFISAGSFLSATAGDTTKLAHPNNINSATNSAEVTLTLPAGFAAGVFADDLGKARHLVVTSNGNVYVKMQDAKKGKGIMRLRDANGDGKADDITGFGDYSGTGIAVKNGYLYASSDEEVFRYKL